MERRVRVQLGSDFTLPTWAVTHYLQQTEINYLRLTTTESICRYAIEGFPLEQLVVATESAELFQRERSSLESFRGSIELTRKDDSAEKFWRIIGRHSRPMVFVQEGNRGYVPLYDFLGTEALVIRQLSINSPFDAVLEGLASSLPDLVYAREREQRARVQWQHEQIGQAAHNLNEIVRASQTIEHPDTPPGVQAYARAMLDQLLDSQQRLNEAAGVEVRRIDDVV
ncbi:hypothetical protein [Aeromonas enteropelogenes]|uniref:hypothetical protein n=1 Tax=Aeromonas enteropelogenes TaxID=29489 RepID=UPI003BA007CE